MNILAYCGHPAQYLFMKNAIVLLTKKGHKVDIIIKSKDILENLINEDGIEFTNILPEGRKGSSFGMLTGMLKRDIRIYKFLRRKKYDLFLGTDPSLSQIGFLKRIPVITAVEDDIDVIPLYGKTTFPFTTYILAPEICNLGKFSHKKISYNGYMKLGFLYPGRFSPSEKSLLSVRNSKFFLIRISRLDAHHDRGIQGITDDVLSKIIDLLKPHGQILISSEKEIPEKFISNKLIINPSEMHSYLAHAEMLICDSQSMAVEASMLGTPCIRYNDFAGRISVLEELEHKYQLTFGIKPTEPEKLFDKINELISTRNLKEEFQIRRQQMLHDKIDVTAFLVWLIENFPGSVKQLNDNPEYQYKFK